MKATVWTASFPIINKRIRVPIVLAKAGNKEKQLTDYLGPSMDIGFRLSKYSTKDLITISLEVACILSLAKKSEKIFEEEEIKIIHNKLEKLKGIYAGQPYPIFWIENLTNLEKARKDIKGDILNPNLSVAPGEIMYNKLYHFCKLYIGKINNKYLLCEPYITKTNKNNEVTTIEGMMTDEHRQELNKYYKVKAISSFKLKNSHQRKIDGYFFK